MYRPQKEINMSLPLEKGTWAADPTHTTIGFVAKHLGFTKVRGQFLKYETKIEAGETLEDSSIEVTVDLNSVTTGNEDRDNHLKGQDFFGASENPTMSFVSTAIKADGDEYKVVGDLTINGKTLPVELDVEFNGIAQDPWGNTKAAFEAKGEINRSDWGIEWNVPVGDGLLVSEKIKIEIDTQLAKA